MIDIEDLISCWQREMKKKVERELGIPTGF
jgi:hypothetical protein